MRVLLPLLLLVVALTGCHTETSLREKLHITESDVYKPIAPNLELTQKTLTCTDDCLLDLATHTDESLVDHLAGKQCLTYCHCVIDRQEQLKTPDSWTSCFKEYSPLNQVWISKWKQPYKRENP